MKIKYILLFLLFLVTNAPAQTADTSPTPQLCNCICLPSKITPTPTVLPTPSPTPTPVISPTPTATPTPTPTPKPVDNFDVPTLLKFYNGAKVVSTSDYPGTDLGGKINQADLACGKVKCIIQIFGNDDFITPAYPSEFRLLKFFPGTHKSAITKLNNYGRIIYPKSNTIIYGTSQKSILTEATFTVNDTDPPKQSLIAPFNLLIIPDGESTSNITKSENIHVIGLRFEGANNPSRDIGLSTVGIGNDDNSSVQDCYFYKTSGYGVSVGGTPGEKVISKVLPDGRTIGYHARNCAILRNTFEGVLAQNLGLITFDGLRVEDNLFLNPGHLQPNGSGSPFLSVIDVEPNGSPREIVRGFVCIRNTIDGRNSIGSQYWGAIAFQITNPDIFNEKNLIADNTILGAENGKSGMSFGINSTSTGTFDLTIARNSVKNAGQAGADISGKNLTVIDNYFLNVGGGGSPGLFMRNVSNSTFTNLKVELLAGGVPGSLDIQEVGTNTNNIWRNVTAGAIIHGKDAIVSDSKYDLNVLKYGVIQNPNSRNNTIDGK